MIVFTKITKHCNTRDIINKISSDFEISLCRLQTFKQNETKVIGSKSNKLTSNEILIHNRSLGRQNIQTNGRNVRGKTLFSKLNEQRSGVCQTVFRRCSECITRRSRRGETDSRSFKFILFFRAICRLFDGSSVLWSR